MASQPVSIVDMEPSSSEFDQNSEPSLAVNPADVSQSLLTAFSATTSPVFYTANGGSSWADVQQIDSSDSTMDWSNGGNAYFVNISGNGQTLQTWSWDAANLQFNLIQNSLLTPGGAGPDQPRVAANHVAGEDHIYIGFNDLSQPTRTASVHYSLDSGTTWNSEVVENVDPGLAQDGYSVRPALSGSTVYLCFERWNLQLANHNIVGDMVVVKDARGGADNFTDLGTDGAIVDASVQFPEGNLGHERTGSDVGFAVSPADPSRLYIAYGAEVNGVAAIKVAMSVDGGVSWTGIYNTTVHSALPDLAVASNGAVGMLYTAYAGGNLETHFIQSDDDFATHRDQILSRFKDDVPRIQYQPYVGDFEIVKAVGTTFYGTFCASNNTALYPFPVTFVRDASKLGVSVPYSIDPFYFTTAALTGSFSNQVPVATSQNFQFSGAGPTTFDVLAAITDPDGDSLTLTSVTKPRHGSLSTNLAGKITYTPNASFAGLDTFQYTVSDGNGGSATGTITIETPYNPVQGIYNGLAVNSPQTNAGTGLFQATVNYRGHFSGKIILGGTTYTCSGSINPGGDASVQAKSATGAAVTLSFQSPLTAGSEITGTATSVSATSPFTASVDPYSTANPAPEAGRYTIAIPHNPADTGALFPQGDGYGSASISTAGLVRVAGVLGDGTPFSQSAYLSGSGSWPFYVAAYSHRGSISGPVTVSGTSAFSAVLQWDKPAHPSDATYPGGFTMAVELTGTTYKAVSGSPAIFTDNGGLGTVVLNGPNTTNLAHHLSVSSQNKITVTDPGADRLKLALSPQKGTITGTFLDTVTGKTVSLGGVVIQPGTGFGLFREGTQAGSMELQE